jgi:hypothetical protein
MFLAVVYGRGGSAGRCGVIGIMSDLITKLLPIFARRGAGLRNGASTGSWACARPEKTPNPGSAATGMAPRASLPQKRRMLPVQ